MDEKQQHRSNVVHEAARLFHLYGYAVSSLDLIARELRIQGIPEYFENEEALAMAAFDYNLACAERVLDECMPPDECALERLGGFVDGFRGMVESTPLDAGSLIFCLTPLQPGALPFLRSRIQAAVSGWRHRIRRVIRLGLRDGDIHPAVDPEEVASVLLSTLEGAAAMYLLYEDSSHLDRAQTHLSAYLSGIAA